jgi:hypothetical protein
MAVTHRIAYEVQVGPIPDGLEIDHLCHNRACMNASHMEPVARAENLRRQVDPLRPLTRANTLKTHCPQGHPYDAANTHMYGRKRVCRACKRERARKQ